uniref:Uncharacterized protein n=1 Tax=Molossus molossus TaxID=27622 RepID=A0A7J8I8M9_MOLMO|nr:hypothetical protein HJG59_010727 [Molossus molossus]
MFPPNQTSGLPLVCTAQQWASRMPTRGLRLGTGSRDLPRGACLGLSAGSGVDASWESCPVLSPPPLQQTPPAPRCHQDGDSGSSRRLNSPSRLSSQTHTGLHSRQPAGMIQSCARHRENATQLPPWTRGSSREPGGRRQAPDSETSAPSCAAALRSLLLPQLQDHQGGSAGG